MHESGTLGYFFTTQNKLLSLPGFLVSTITRRSLTYRRSSDLDLFVCLRVSLPLRLSGAIEIVLIVFKDMSQ